MKQNPVISLIALNHNGLERTERWLESARLNAYVLQEIIVVDNPSDAATVRWLRNQPDVMLFESHQNTCIAAANNAGMRLATGQLLVLCNNDVRLPEGCAERFFYHNSKNSL